MIDVKIIAQEDKIDSLQSDLLRSLDKNLELIDRLKKAERLISKCAERLEEYGYSIEDMKD